MSKVARMKGSEPTKRALVHVLGCKVSQAEAAAMTHVLRQHGYAVEADTPNPDLIVVNTCCVTSRAEGKSRRLVRGLAAKYPSAQLIVTGCLAEVYPESVRRISPKLDVIGTFAKDRFAEFIPTAAPELIKIDLAPDSERLGFGNLSAAASPGRARAFLKVQDGCSQGCTYCIVPRARGPSRSLPVDRAAAYAREMEASGFAEIVLTGIHLGAYGRDLEPGLIFEDLLERLLETCPETRFRLSSVEPQEITHRLIELVGHHPRVCRHFHIPVQSGDDAILARMGRPYDSTLILGLMERIFSVSPDACVGMDIMVAFPGEDERSFERTRGLVMQLNPAYLHVFPFSPRPGTPAASFRPLVPDNEAKRRVEEFRALSTVLRGQFYERFIGRILVVVPEETSEAPEGVVRVRSDNYIPIKVALAGDAHRKKQFQVRIERIEGADVWGVYASGI